MSRPTRSQLKALELAIRETASQLETCSTTAMIICVQERLDDLRRQLAVARGES